MTVPYKDERSREREETNGLLLFVNAEGSGQEYDVSATCGVEVKFYVSSDDT